LGRKDYFWGGLVGVLVLLPVVFLVLCFLLPFLAGFAGVVLFWSGAGWLGAGAWANVSGKVAAAKTIASKLFFMWISP
jgi:hypothetical protein